MDRKVADLVSRAMGGGPKAQDAAEELYKLVESDRTGTAALIVASKYPESLPLRIRYVDEYMRELYRDLEATLQETRLERELQGHTPDPEQAKFVEGFREHARQQHLAETEHEETVAHAAASYEDAALLIFQQRPEHFNLESSPPHKPFRRVTLLGKLALHDSVLDEIIAKNPSLLHEIVARDRTSSSHVSVSRNQAVLGEFVLYELAWPVYGALESMGVRSIAPPPGGFFSPVQKLEGLLSIAREESRYTPEENLTAIGPLLQIDTYEFSGGSPQEDLDAARMTVSKLRQFDYVIKEFQHLWEPSPDAVSILGTKGPIAYIDPNVLQELLRGIRKEDG
jgi:hypothetical protein